MFTCEGLCCQTPCMSPLIPPSRIKGVGTSFVIGCPDRFWGHVRIVFVPVCVFMYANEQGCNPSKKAKNSPSSIMAFSSALACLGSFLFLLCPDPRTLLSRSSPFYCDNSRGLDSNPVLSYSIFKYNFFSPKLLSVPVPL